MILIFMVSAVRQKRRDLQAHVEEPKKKKKDDGKKKDEELD